jgi:hypothetical protein
MSANMKRREFITVIGRRASLDDHRCLASSVVLLIIIIISAG